MADLEEKVTIATLRRKKAAGEKITRVVLWDYTMALLADQAGVDMILVGDSVGMAMLGYANTLPVTMEEMVHHCRAVNRGRRRAMLVGDLPFMSYEADTAEAVRNAGRLIKEGGADAVKLEGGEAVAETVRAMVRSGIPVHGHIGLTPQKIKQMGGFKTQGKTVESALSIFKDALALADAGCFALTVECVPPVMGGLISRRLPEVVVISAGAGPECDGQSVNLYDLIGLTQKKVPKFIKRYAAVGETVLASIDTFCRETRQGLFPSEEHTYAVDREISEAIRLAADSQDR